MKDIIIPERNRRDMDELTDDVKEGVTFHPVSEMDEVIRLAFPADTTVLMSEKEYKEALERKAAEAKAGHLS